MGTKKMGKQKIIGTKCLGNQIFTGTKHSTGTRKSGRKLIRNEMSGNETSPEKAVLRRGVLGWGVCETSGMVQDIRFPITQLVWCYAHILNLVIAYTTGGVLASASLISLLNKIAVFIRESYQRMNIWKKESHNIHHKRLSTIGEIRWWSKDAALKIFFVYLDKPASALYC